MANDTKVYVGKDGAKALYKRLKDQLGKITTYQKVTNTTSAGVPVVTNPNSRTIYLVKDNSVVGDDKYKEWIWNAMDLWECIGTTSIPENAWKQWSEDNGSSGTQGSIYIGSSSTVTASDSAVVGNSNTVGGTNTIGVFGNNNTVSGQSGGAVVIGHNTTASAADRSVIMAVNGSVSMVDGCTILGSHFTVEKEFTISNSRFSTLIGCDSTLQNVDYSVVVGDANTLNKTTGSSSNCYNSAVFGNNNEVTGTSNQGVGSYNTVAGESTAVFGSNNTAKSNQSIVAGCLNAVSPAGSGTLAYCNTIIGQMNSIRDGRGDVVIIGETTTISNDAGDNVNYAGTNIVSIGKSNNATSAANAYQLGRDNTITGNNLALAASYPHSLSVNIGRNNTITGEGLNLGKDNTSTTFGITLGQDISASSGSISIGRSIKDTTYTTGTNSTGGSISIGFNAVASGNSIAIGSNTSAASSTTASGSSIAIGATSTVSGGSYSFGLNNTVAGGSVAVGTNNTLSTGANAYAFGNNNTVKNFAFAVGRSNTVGNDNNTSYNLFAFGANNTVPNGEAFVVGCFNTTPSSNGVGKINVFGYSNSATGSVAQIFGYNNTNVNCAVALGISNSDINGHSVAVGIDNKAQGEAMAFGKGNTAYSGSVSLGVNNKVSASGTAGVCAGKGNTIVSGGYNVALGTENYANLEAISIGSRNDVSGWSFAYGVENRTERVNGSHALLLGMYNESSSNKEHLNWEVPTSMDTSEFLPTRVVRGYTFSEQIIPITALENQGGSVTRIRFNYTVTHNTVRTFEVYVGETSKTVFDTSSDWIPVSSLTKVYGGEVTFHLQGDRTAIEFTTPFNLSNGKNLVFALYDKTGTPADYTIPFNIIKTNANTALLMWSDTEFTLGNLPSGVKTNAISLIDVTIDGYNISTYDSVFIGDMPETSSILLGARNQSRHHNSILLGYGNRSYRPLPVPQGQLYDDDDGFIVAIGRENRVGRNYDTAIGCKSVANGGHALAIGSYLEANPWQSVLGFYNKVIASDKDGANEYRTTSTYSSGMYAIYNDDYYRCIHDNVTGIWSESDWVKDVPATFIVGTGYTKANDTIVRKNAMELYANGDLKVTGDITANNIPAAPSENGEYMLKCSVSNGTKTYTWVAMNTATVV